MDTLNKAIINGLQGGFPVVERPYAAVAERLGTTEADLIKRLEDLLARGILTRFGPMYNAERLGGALSLVAMKIPAGDLDRVASIVNAFPEVAHNYARDHAFNMWFVVATETRAAKASVLAEITRSTGYPVYDMPKTEEFFVGLRFAV